MANEDEDRGHAPAGWRRRQRWALGIAVPSIAVLAGLWVERRPIAGHLIDRTLAASGVAARYRLVDLGPGRQRLEDVVIGDPAWPDLVADWIETQTAIGLGGPVLTGVRAGHVRLRGRLVGGRLSLGAIDRLLPAGRGGTGGLPALTLDLGDARLRLETAAGLVGVALSGSGGLRDGFGGRVALVAPALASGGCGLAGTRGALRVGTSRGQVRVEGPVAAERLACGATRLANPRLQFAGVLDPAASTWRNEVRLASGALDDPRARAAAVTGVGTIARRSGAASGTVSLVANRVVAAAGAAAQLSLAGRYSMAGESRFDGTLALTGASVDRRPVAAVHRVANAAEATPLGPLAARMAAALQTASRSFGGGAAVSVIRRGSGVEAAVRHAELTARSGGIVRFDGVADAAGAIDGVVTLSGGGLPSLAATLRRASAATPLTGVLTARRYAAAGASLALTPASFRVDADGAVQVASVATLSGPLGRGRVEGLTLPLALNRDARGAVGVGEGCTPVSFGRLAFGGLRLDPAWLRLCPVAGPLVRMSADGAIGGGARISALRLTGRLGDNTLSVAAGAARLSLASRDFAVQGGTATLGAADRVSRFTMATLSGRLAGGDVRGGFAGAGGQIGAVPLLLSGAAGRWSIDGALSVEGGIAVADADAAAPRFNPLAAQDVSLRLADGRITATGSLAEPTTGTRVATVRIAHDLTSGAGTADLAVDKLSFAKGFQPDLLTPLTKGTVADVAGTIDGEGHIGWSAAGLTSTGRFATAGTDLAAAFGPVTGIAGSIVFTDLLGLVSAPGQGLTIASINPGVPVENGVVRFHLEPGTRVAVESARWPFAGGTLSLDPTLLDLAAPTGRRLTFRLDGVAADRFLQQFEFRNLAATGTFDGVLPMVFDADGGRIENGRLTVRERGGTLAYVGDVSQKDLGFWGNLAFQALKSLRYRSLGIAMNGPLAGEMVTEVRFAGVSQGEGARSNVLVRRLQRLPFVFNVRIKAPFRTLLDSLDPARQVQLALPRLIEQERHTVVQPPVSVAVP